jgi:hypothetical protein
MSHNKGVTTKLVGEHVFKFEESPQNKDDGSMGSLNFISYLIKPLMPFKISHVTKSCVISMVNFSLKSRVTKTITLTGMLNMSASIDPNLNGHQHS